MNRIALMTSRKMRSMFFGDPPSFEQVLETINEIQESFRRVDR